MRSLTLPIVVAVVVMMSGIANAEDDTISNRQTANVFVTAGFPAEIIEAAQTADEVAKQTQENRIRAKQDLELIEPVFDRAVFMPQIPLELFEKLQRKYEAALQKFWDTDQELRQADDRVAALYYNWTLDNSDVKLAEVFQEWQTASRLSYLTLNDEEAEAYRLMIGIGRARIIAGYHERGSWRRPAPLKMWRVKNDN